MIVHVYNPRIWGAKARMLQSLGQPELRGESLPQNEVATTFLWTMVRRMPKALPPLFLTGHSRKRVPFALPLFSLPFLSSFPALKEQTSQVENHDGGDRRGGLDTGIQGNGFQISKCYVGGMVLRVTVKTVLPGHLSPRPLLSPCVHCLSQPYYWSVSSSTSPPPLIILY